MTISYGYLVPFSWILYCPITTAVCVSWGFSSVLNETQWNVYKMWGRCWCNQLRIKMHLTMIISRYFFRQFIVFYSSFFIPPLCGYVICGIRTRHVHTQHPFTAFFFSQCNLLFYSSFSQLNDTTIYINFSFMLEVKNILCNLISCHIEIEKCFFMISHYSISHIFFERNDSCEEHVNLNMLLWNIWGCNRQEKNRLKCVLWH